MLLTLIIILLLIGSAVVGAIYSNFTTFYRSFGETENYNKAYYAAISALERAELVIKQRSPGYEGSGGRIKDVAQNSSSDNKVDGPTNDFSYLGSGNQTDMLREIKSRTRRIPVEGEGDIEPELAGNNSTNYNKMDYENAEVFLLYYDTSDKSPYTGGTIEKSSFSNSDKIEGEIKLPPKLQSARSSNADLNTDYPLIAGYGNPKNDAIVDRQIRGKYDNTLFTIGASQNSSNDSSIRESHLNDGVSLNFLRTSKTPLGSNTNSTPTIISAKEQEIKNYSLNQIFTLDSSFSGLTIRLSLLNLLKTKDGLIYPYLEYYMNFGNTIVSDKYYTITTRGKIADFQVDITIQKPTVKESILGNFTVIF